MYLAELTLDQFRSYPHLTVSFQPGLTLILGANATGKSNLLEAIYLLATTRSPRVTTAGEVIAWEAPSPAVARVAGAAVRQDGPVQIEIALVTRTDAQGAVLSSTLGAPLISKRIRLNGVARRAADAIGQITAVLFTTLDIAIISGAPSLRRRYLDFTIAQFDRRYASAIGRYDRAVTQRNALLRRIAEGAAVDELGSWDDIVGEEGSSIVAARAAALRTLGPRAAEHHRRITAATALEADDLQLTYRPALGGADLPAAASAQAVAPRLLAALRAERAREIGARRTLVGPHRDDLTIQLNGRSAAAFASRAQQRSIALALRLAEADLLRAATGEQPILLLDDIFSELDRERRAATAQALTEAQQVIVTSADAAAVPAEMPAPVASYRAEEGRLVALGS